MSVLSHRVIISITYIVKYKLNKKSVTRETITLLQVGIYYSRNLIPMI